MRILDLGAGTGVVGMLVAARFPLVQVDLLEMDKGALSDLKNSIPELPFADRIRLLEEDLFQWQADAPYDLVLSNPPYFMGALPATEQGRQRARHTTTGGLQKWMQTGLSCLRPGGKLAVILPADTKLYLPGWSLAQKCLVFSKPKGRAERQLLSFERSGSGKRIKSKIILRDENGDRHDDYRALMGEHLYLDGLPKKPSQ